MLFNGFAIALCVFAAADLVAARPTLGGVSVDVQAAPEQVACRGSPAAGDEAAAGESKGEAQRNEPEIQSTFDTAIPVQGGNLKQDLVFTPSTVGKFEFEFQSPTTDQVTVRENTAPAAPPPGFEAIEPNSYVVALAPSQGAGLTLSKIDFIFDAAAAAAGLAGKDITAAQVGKLCAETGVFVVGESLGELEFEGEEGEVTLSLSKNVTAQGEWGIFLPVAGAAGRGAAAGGAVAEGGGKAGAGHAAMAIPKQEAAVELKGHAKNSGG